MKTICDVCNTDVRRFKDLKKLKKQHLCKDCYRANRLKFRNETIEESGIREKIKELDKEINRGYYDKDKQRELSRNRYRKAHNIPLDAPLNPKGSIVMKVKVQSYITFRERQQLFGLFIRRGFNREEASERVKSLVNFEKELRKTMKYDEANEKIELTKQQMLEELWSQ